MEPILGFWLRQPHAVICGLLLMTSAVVGTLFPYTSFQITLVSVVCISNFLEMVSAESLPTLGILAVSKRRMFLLLTAPLGVSVAIAAVIGALWLPVQAYGKMFLFLETASLFAILHLFLSLFPNQPPVPGMRRLSCLYCKYVAGDGSGARLLRLVPLILGLGLVLSLTRQGAALSERTIWIANGGGLVLIMMALRLACWGFARREYGGQWLGAPKHWARNLVDL